MFRSAIVYIPGNTITVTHVTIVNNMNMNTDQGRWKQEQQNEHEISFKQGVQIKYK